MKSEILASGPGWSVSDVVCSAGPRDRPFEEQHGAACIAAVTQGTFQYRTTQGAVVLAPGAILLGDAGHCFECGHEHGSGDRCLTFHFTPAHLEDIAAGVPGARRTGFAVPRLPPLPELVPLIAAAEAARDDRDAEAFESLALRFASAVIATLAGATHAGQRPSLRDEKRISDSVRTIATRSHERFALAELADDAAMSPYHFLRTFRHVVGTTPHQFLLRTRLHRAAVRLRRSDEAISTIAIESGFDDLSTFNRRFRRFAGVSPGMYRGRTGDGAPRSPSA